MQQTRYTPEKPCDIVAMFGSVGCLIECKQVKTVEAFGMRHMRPSQIKNLDEVVNKGGLGFVFLNVRVKGAKGVSKHMNKLIIFDWYFFRQQEESIKAKQLVEILSRDGWFDGDKLGQLGVTVGFKDLFDLSSFADRMRKLG
jgi:hypothetical protein